MKIKRNQRISISLVTLVGLGFFLYPHKEPEKLNIEEKILSVSTTIVDYKDNDAYLQYSALIQPQTLEKVTFPTISTIKEIYVEEGDTVKKGQCLLTLDDEVQQNQISNSKGLLETSESAMNSSKANLDSANTQYNAALNQQNSDPDKITAETNLKEANQNLETAQNNMDDVNRQLSFYQDDLANKETILNDNEKRLATKQEEHTKLTNELEQLNIEITTATSAVNEAQQLVDSDPENIEYQNLLTQALLTLTQLQENKQVKEQELLNKQAEIDDLSDEIKTNTQDVNDAQIALDSKKDETNYTQITLELESTKNKQTIAKASLDSIIAQNKLELEVLENAKISAQYSYDSSKSAYETAQENVQNAQKDLDNYRYLAQNDGIVLSIVSETNGVATPLIPVMVLGSSETIAQFGVSQSDISLLEIGNSVEILRDDQILAGQVTKIGVVPDETSRTYLCDVLISSPPTDLLIGELVNLKIYTGQANGIWLPIQIILNDGEDYVYVVEDNRAIRKTIQIVDMNDDEVMVTGLQTKDEVITQGMTQVSSGTKVSVVK